MAAAGAGHRNNGVTRRFVRHKGNRAEVQAALWKIAVNNGQPGIGNAAQSCAAGGV